MKKNYNPSQKFDSKKYCFHNPDVKENKICPLLHYEKYGKKEGRKTFYISEQDDATYKSYKFKRYLKRKISKIINYQKIQKNKEVKKKKIPQIRRKIITIIRNKTNK